VLEQRADDGFIYPHGLLGCLGRQSGFVAVNVTPASMGLQTCDELALQVVGGFFGDVWSSEADVFDGRGR
jgi:hypothetical protein